MYMHKLRIYFIILAYHLPGKHAVRDAAGAEREDTLHDLHLLLFLCLGLYIIHSVCVYVCACACFFNYYFKGECSGLYIIYSVCVFF